jgi:hypothetical protein
MVSFEIDATIYVVIKYIVCQMVIMIKILCFNANNSDTKNY